jgi:hypothetical protein
MDKEKLEANISEIESTPVLYSGYDGEQLDTVREAAARRDQLLGIIKQLVDGAEPEPKVIPTKDPRPSLLTTFSSETIQTWEGCATPIELSDGRKVLAVPFYTQSGGIHPTGEGEYDPSYEIIYRNFPEDVVSFGIVFRMPEVADGHDQEIAREEDVISELDTIQKELPFSTLSNEELGLLLNKKTMIKNVHAYEERLKLYDAMTTSLELLSSV